VNTIMIRRKKADVLSQLPGKRRNRVVMQLHDAESALKLAAISQQLNANKAALYAAAKGRAEHSVQSAARREHQHLLMQLFLKTAELKEQLVYEHLV
jgi:hypothetical protein